MRFAKIGIMGAMQDEIKFLLQNMDNARETILGTGKGARSYWHGTLYGKNTTLAFSRWGKSLRHPPLRVSLIRKESTWSCLRELPARFLRIWK